MHDPFLGVCLPHDSGPGLSFLLVALVLFGAFVVLLGVIAAAAGRVTRGDAEGRRGCLGGCGLAAMLVVLGALGVIGLVAFVLFTSVVAAVEHNPVRRIEVQVDEEDEDRLGQVPVRLRFEVVGEVGEEIAHRVAQELADEIGRKGQVWFEPRRTSEGGEGGAAVIEVLFRVDRDDVDELREAARAVAGRGVDGVSIELESSVGF